MQISSCAWITRNPLRRFLRTLRGSCPRIRRIWRCFRQYRRRRSPETKSCLHGFQTSLSMDSVRTSSSGSDPWSESVRTNRSSALLANFRVLSAYLSLAMPYDLMATFSMPLVQWENQMMNASTILCTLSCTC